MNQEQMTSQDFHKILKRNGFADKNTVVKRHIRFNIDGEASVEFDVKTNHAMNIGNLISIERRYGLALYYVGPLENNTMWVKFGRVYPRN